MILHGYFRSSASYRVRIALNLKGLRYTNAFHPLRRGEQRSESFLRLNPQGLVPALELEDGVLTQSLAICEYINESYPHPPLLPADIKARSRVRAFAQLIACDVHPLQNLKVLKRLEVVGLSNTAVTTWASDVIAEGLEAASKLIAGETGPYCFGEQVTLADICLVPQLANARRFDAKIDWPRLLQIEAACLAVPAFRAAAPGSQPDAE